MTDRNNSREKPRATRRPRSPAIARLTAKVFAVVASIPEGRVTTYGAIGQHLHITARQSAFVLARLTAEESAEIPWHRVVAANGFVSTTKLGSLGRKQIAKLRAEGVFTTPRNKIEEFASIVWSPGEIAGHEYLF